MRQLETRLACGCAQGWPTGQWRKFCRQGWRLYCAQLGESPPGRRSQAWADHIDVPRQPPLPLAEEQGG